MKNIFLKLTLALVAVFSLGSLSSCVKKEVVPAGKDTVYVNSTSTLTKDSLQKLLAELESSGGKKLYTNTFNFTVSGKRSDSVAYSYTDTYTSDVYENDYLNLSSGGDGYYFYVYTKNNNSMYLQFRNLDFSNADLSEASVYSYGFNKLQFVNDSTVHGLGFEQYGSNSGYIVPKLTNLSYNKTTRIFSGNIFIPKQYENNYEKTGSTAQVTGTFSFYIPKKKEISRKENY
ncbi:MAG: hypothetical protein U0V72_15495 [Cytophagales bacterium]